jgi:hypothetical protein
VGRLDQSLKAKVVITDMASDEAKSMFADIMKLDDDAASVFGPTVSGGDDLLRGAMGAAPAFIIAASNDVRDVVGPLRLAERLPETIASASRNRSCWLGNYFAVITGNEEVGRVQFTGQTGSTIAGDNTRLSPGRKPVYRRV